MNKLIKRLSIVGYGRFGKVLHRLLKDDFDITVYKRSKITDRSEFNKNTTIAQTVEDIYKSDVIFYSVPIESFEQVIADHKKYFKDDHLLIDVLSVKLHPEKIFKKYLKGTKIQALLTHPMFGPDSSKQGFENLPIVLDKFRTDTTNYKFWKNYFIGKKLKIIEISAKEHDRLAASSQGLTHFIGRLLDSYGFKKTPIDSLGAKKLLEIKEQTCNDTWQLFSNLQQYNPYTVKMRIKLGNKFDRLYNKLLPERKKSDCLVYGIQGGKGSFNEEAANYYFEKEGIKKYKIKYLYTSANVMKELHLGLIDRGQFAIHNSTGGIVDESIEAMANYKFKIVNKYAIKIAHALMIRKDADLSEITTIMTHPQVLAQCRQTLQQKYPHLKQISGKGKLVDHALVAKKMSEKKMPKNIATMGSKILAKLYDLKIVEDNLQDLKENYTTFLQAKRL
jgi:prephenate dehydrogenase